METETYYDILGLLPNASHRQVVRAFGELAGRFQQDASDPIARERFQQVKAAYQTLTNYESRLRYNIERGLPDPPRHGKDEKKPGFVEEVASVIPSRWYVFAFVAVGFVYLVVSYLFDYHGPMPVFP
jgi:curved DNA-binding protein CbpA